MSEICNPGCDYCRRFRVEIVLQEPEFERLSPTVAIFKCPRCGIKILDDIAGWKGSGVTMVATEEMIEQYMKATGTSF